MKLITSFLRTLLYLFTLLAPSIAIFLATVQPAHSATLYLDVGTGHQWDMEEKYVRSIGAYSVSTIREIPSWVATVEAGLEHKGLYLQVQHISAPEDESDHGFNAITAGYRYVFKF